MTDQDKINEVTAALNGHDPREWFNPERPAIARPGKTWIIVKKDSHLVYFATEEEAWRFKRTGVMP